ncbi:MAG: PQQ-binding-like beta-propeller repeat protein [Vicinamibacterales bacterium]
MTIFISRLFTILSVAVLAAASLLAQDWPQWRGPSRTGAAVGVTLPATWPDRPKQIWKVQAGAGHASPIVASGRVFLFSRAGEQEAVSARDLGTGKEIWRAAYDATYQMNPAATAHGKGPKSTPAFDRGRVFTFGIGGIVSAWQAQDGRLLWRRDFKKEFPTTSPDFGVAMSPVVAGDLVIVHAGGTSNGALLALDVASGAAKWSWKADGPAYASPVIAGFGGTPQIITQSQRHVVGISLADGRLLWEIPFATPYEQNSITPVIVNDLLIYSGLDKPTTAVKVSVAQGQWQIAPVWQNADLPMYMSTAVESGGYLYGLTHRNRGQFFCVEAATGKTMWTTKGREGENAALVTAGELVMAMTTEGELVIFRANPKAFDPVKRYTLAESAVWAHPAPVSGGVVVKDVDTLAYWAF